jgi:glutamate/tyrosine decarboxylase-like PLP-dependent enzyme
VATHFKLRLCTEEEKFLADCETWDLLNLIPDEVASLLTRIAETFGFSLPALQAMLNKYLIQTTGKDEIEKYFGIQHSPQYLCPTTAHYSWPKGAGEYYISFKLRGTDTNLHKGVVGIGSNNIIGVPVDEQARMDCQALDLLLEEFIQHRRAIYAVVVIMGTTEHGSIDPLSKVLALRRKYQKRGLSFLIHADAAWGGYFASMLVPNPAISGFERPHDEPTFFLNPYVENELRHLRFADSVTIDPHKSGYTPFPAGALCYRDGRLRFMVTCKSPVTGLEVDSTELGIYGLEGRLVRASYNLRTIGEGTQVSLQQARCSTAGRVAGS